MLFFGTMVIAVIQLSQPANFYHPEFDNHPSVTGAAYAYPPGVGIITKSKNCLACHTSEGPWNDESKTIIDVLDAGTMKSLKQSDGSFLIEVKRNEARSVLTVIGRVKGDTEDSPYRNAWTYVDPKTIETSSLTKFAPGWECNLPLSCRVVGDKLEIYEGARITSLPMIIRPTDAAQDGELQLQVMLTKGEAVKGDAKRGMAGNYFERKVTLRVIE